LPENIEPQPIFVVGPPRCGTTLTGRILGMHPRIFVPSERSFFERIYNRESKPGDQWQSKYLALIQKYWIDTNTDAEHRELVSRIMANPATTARLKQSSDPADFYDAFMSAQAQASGKSRWCTQTHNDLFHLPTIFSMYPWARVIVCIRHPLDFLTSYRDKWQRNARRNRPEKAQRLRLLYHPVVTSFFWLINVRTIRRALARLPGSVLLIRYEDLVHAPDATLNKLCAFISEDFAPAMLRPGFNNSSTVIEVGGIFTGSVGRWKETLPTADAYVGQLICRRAMRRFGYSAVQLRPAPIAVLRHLLGAPLSAFKILEGRATAHRGWFIRYVARRLALPSGARRGAGPS
jgi:hypothetical protein